MGSEFHLRAISDDSARRPRIKPPPQSTAISAPFSYSPSDDGTDENLLVLLHGLGSHRLFWGVAHLICIYVHTPGDTHIPFSKLGLSFHLPQTATLALRAPQQYVALINLSSSILRFNQPTHPFAVGAKRIPYLYEHAFQWYPSFDALGDILAHPDPTTAIDYITNVLHHLVNDCGWPAPRIHLFGFAQGGSVAAESALKWWRRNLQQQKSDDALVLPLGSVVTVGGPLLSYPTLSATCPTPIMVFHRPPPTEPFLPGDALPAFRKGFSRVVDAKMSGVGMPRSKNEWYPIMELWSERLGRRQVDGLYEVMTGSSI
jgi:predicted esterase